MPTPNHTPASAPDKQTRYVLTIPALALALKEALIANYGLPLPQSREVKDPVERDALKSAKALLGEFESRPEFYTKPVPSAPAEGARHTPGPWRYEPETRTIRSVPANYWLATLDSWDGAVNNEANAALIASAPTLAAERDRLKAALEKTLAQAKHYGPTNRAELGGQYAVDVIEEAESALTGTGPSPHATLQAEAKALRSERDGLRDALSKESREHTAWMADTMGAVLPVVAALKSALLDENNFKGFALRPSVSKAAKKAVAGFDALPISATAPSDSARLREENAALRKALTETGEQLEDLIEAVEGLDGLDGHHTDTLANSRVVLRVVVNKTLAKAAQANASALTAKQGGANA